MRTDLHLEQYIEPIAIAATLDYLDTTMDESENYISRLSRAGDTVLEELNLILDEVKHKFPYFEGVFEHLDAIKKMSVSSLSRFWFELSSKQSDLSISEWFDLVIEKYDVEVGRSQGGSTSPKVINEIATKILRPINGTFYDGMAGFGGSLKYVADFSERNNGKIQVYGQEISAKNWAISKVRLFISGYGEADIRKGDLFAEPAFIKDERLKKFDYAFVDGPFGMPISQYDAIKNDKYNRFLYGIPPKRNSELGTASHVIASLNEEGRGLIVVPSGALFRSGAEEQIRKNIISTDIIEAVIALPGGLYNNTAIPSNLILFNKNKQSIKKEKILFINAEESHTEVNRRERTISEQDIQQIVDTVLKGEELSGYSKIIPLSEIREGNLAPNRYVVSTERVIDDYGKIEFSWAQFNDIDTKPLADLVTFFRGYNATSKNESDDGPYKVLKISDVQKGEIIRENIKSYNVENNTKVDAYRLLKGDVIVSVRGQTIKVAEVDYEEENLLLSQNFMGIRCGKNLNPTYLKLYMESPVGQYLLSSKLTGSVIPTLNKSDLLKFPIPMKSIEEQNKLVKQYLARESHIKQEIERLKAELMESKMDVYQSMGLKEVFTITK